jgi:ubiquinone/menaquinone biosynthesis C-methylase UbiE
MSITADQERQFYDEQYARYLDAPDSDLVCNRHTLAADLANPHRAIFERRRLYSEVLRILLSQPLAGRTVLDYGCGTGDWGLLLAAEGAHATLLDLSPAAIQLIERRARAGGVAARVRAVARDASDLTCFRDGEFDLIYAGAALHHTIKYPRAIAELVRVLRPGGTLLLAETYGNNRLLNAVRRLRWRWTGQPDEAGEEVLLSSRELTPLLAHLERAEIRPLNLLAMSKRLFRGRFHRPSVRAVIRCCEALDRMLLGALPFLRRYCGEVIVVAEK